MNLHENQNLRKSHFENYKSSEEAEEENKIGLYWIGLYIIG